MKKRIIGIISVILAFSLILTANGVAAEPPADSVGDISRGKAVVNAFGVVADALITGVARLFPPVDWPSIDEYQSENFLTGTAAFAREYTQGDTWYAGYGSESIIPEDFEENGYVTAGDFHITKELCSKILEGDDQRVAAVALKINEDGETVLFISIDGFGMTSTNVRTLRGRLAELAQANNIVSINVSLSHAHSCIDTHGLGASILGLVGQSIIRGLLSPLRLFGIKRETKSTDEAFMELLYSQSLKAASAAISAMQPGTMSYNAFDIGDLIHDKQLPNVYDTNVNQIKFIPFNEGAREIWLVNMGVHPVRMGGDRVVSSDYPGAIVRMASELANADAAFYQGAQLAITREEAGLNLGGSDEYNSLATEAEKSFFAVNAYGKEVVSRMMTAEPVESVELEPILNIRHKELSLPVTNSLLLLIAKIEMINNIVVKTSIDFTQSRVITEVGYCELGKHLAIGIMPGELDPEIAFGGTRTAAESWNGTDWKYPPFNEVVGSERKLIMFGLTNDQIGYIVPDNDYAHAFASLFEDLIGGGANKHYEEMISLGKGTAPGIAQAFIEAVNETK